jgi:hypothetical protein
MFKIGDKVKAVAFTDCFGEFHKESSTLTVTKVQKIINDCPHTRIIAVGDSGYHYIEGGERFFKAV